MKGHDPGESSGWTRRCQDVPWEETRCHSDKNNTQALSNSREGGWMEREQGSDKKGMEKRIMAARVKRVKTADGGDEEKGERRWGRKQQHLTTSRTSALVFFKGSSQDRLCVACRASTAADTLKVYKADGGDSWVGQCNGSRWVGLLQAASHVSLYHWWGPVVRGANICGTSKLYDRPERFMRDRLIISLQTGQGRIGYMFMAISEEFGQLVPV